MVPGRHCQHGVPRSAREIEVIARRNSNSQLPDSRRAGPRTSPPYVSSGQAGLKTRRFSSESLCLVVATQVNHRLSAFRGIEQPVRVGVFLRDGRHFNFHGHVAMHVENL